MMRSHPIVKYLLDTNVFIQAKRQRYYGFDRCPGFWEFINWSHEQERAFSIDRVKQEIEVCKDDLSDWADCKMPDTFFKSTQNAKVLAHYPQIIAWVQQHQKFLKNSKDDFAKNADGWLVALAKATGYTLVTHEKYHQQEQKAKIPNVCKNFGVRCIDTFDMLCELNVNFTWQPPV